MNESSICLLFIPTFFLIRPEGMCHILSCCSKTPPTSPPPHRHGRHPGAHPLFRALWTSPVALRKRTERTSQQSQDPGALEEILPSSHTPSVRAVSFQKCLASAAPRGTCCRAGVGACVGKGPSLALSSNGLSLSSF